MAKKKKKPTRSKLRPPKGPGFEKLSAVNGLSLPVLFHSLWDNKLWRQPEDELIAQLMPWLTGPIDFLLDARSIRSESLGKLADIPLAAHFREYRGSTSDDCPDLPWLDVDLHVMIACNRHYGDDLGVAMDYRSSTTDPRVVGSKWVSTTKKDFDHIEWTVISNTFSEFAHSLGFAG